ncbi:uncharacterized protein BDV17DRAFT_252131 [Aspergillus undulatus]|uniref:uncharacterized protein n=1 Tax=Aspergillus undulatus TaxID=1810928 RepID=UPI003CCDC3FF
MGIWTWRSCLHLFSSADAVRCRSAGTCRLYSSSINLQGIPENLRAASNCTSFGLYGLLWPEEKDSSMTNGVMKVRKGSRNLSTIGDSFEGICERLKEPN